MKLFVAFRGEGVIETDSTMFFWASLSQIKELAFMDDCSARS
jgi:hypothetical protein